jgi:hypothetical protein
MKKFVVSGLVAGAGAALVFGLPAEAATPKATVVYSSSSYLTNRFSVHDREIAVLTCTTLNRVGASGGSGVLPAPGCNPKAESDGGVAYSRDGATVAQTMTLQYANPAAGVESRLYRFKSGAYLTSTDVAGHEYTVNPDRRARYGSRSTKSCVTKALGGDAGYAGRLDSSLPSVAAGPGQSWYVVDRDGNTVYRVSETGKLSVLAVLPPVTVTVSKTLAKTSRWSSCVVGTKVSYEPAPSEVEVAPDGTVYVAGRPRLKSGRATPWSVMYAINPSTKKVKVLPQRYTGTVDLAVGTSGRLFAAHPGLGRISVIRKGKSSTYLKLSRVLAVEADKSGRLHAVRGAGSDPKKTPATVVRIS